jgi:hypothetical protein
MTKRPRQTPRQPVPAVATAARFDGEAVKIELVMQPQDAAHLADQIVNALVAHKSPR